MEGSRAMTWTQRGQSRRPEQRNRSALVRLAALAALLALLVAACGSDDDDTSDSSEGASFDQAAEPDAGGSEDTGDSDFDEEPVDDSVATEAEAPQVAPESGADLADSDSADEDDRATDDGADGSLGTGATNITPTAADLGRKLIFTAFVTVAVDDVAAASAEATSIIEELGGFLFGQNTTGGPEASSELIFKVLPDDFNRALEQLGTVGELRNQSVSTDDVTERIVDLESRIEVADLGVQRLRAALEDAPTLEDFAEIERLLLDRESTLEVMRGQLRTLEDRVDLATITLLLTQDRVENAISLEISAYQDHDNGESCPGQQGFSLEAGSEVTVCFDVVNRGDQTLTNIVLTDTVLEIDGDTQLIDVFGSLDELAPGQSALVAFQINPERTLRLRTRVVAIPTDGVTSEQTGPSVSTQVNFDLRTFEADSDPGFGDGFSVGVGILKGLWVALTVTLGFLSPLLVLVLVLGPAWWGWRAWCRRHPPKPTPQPSPTGGYQPPPPPPPPSQDVEAERPHAETDGPGA